MIRLKDLQKVYNYPKEHQWEDAYKNHCGWCLASGLRYKDIGLVSIKDKKFAWAEFQRRAKNKEYRLKNETYLEFKRRIK